MFTSMEATGFAQRAERELGVTAASARTRSPETRFHLTAQESRIARLASEGMTNPQIASELFISARTVEYHLHKVFTKLGVDSRHRLAKALVETIPVGAGR
jgi:DNA-binding NarL/FixJ family response regulator